MKAFIIASALALSLSASAHAGVVTPAAQITILTNDLQTAMVADLKNAADEAKAHGDLMHWLAWKSLIRFIHSNKPGRN